MKLWLAAAVVFVPGWIFGQTTRPFDGSPWNLSTGNLSTFFIQASPVGAYPKPNVLEPPPSHEALVQLKQQGLVAYEDYLAWGAIERELGKWDWTQHDRICDALHAAGLHYVAYTWLHFPPVWLRERPDTTLMTCQEHHQRANYLSIFDPRTIEHYDHFYKALKDHFGDKIDGVYACILGPYGEGNYPLLVPDWVNMGHCHEGYWCADPFALASLRRAMRGKYGEVTKLNEAWAADYKGFDEITPPVEIVDKFKPSPATFPTAAARRRWLDFITWYHQSLIDFAEQSIHVTLKYFPKEKVRTKPGGTAGGINPVAWGTYSPGFAKMAAPYGVYLQPADCQGAYFADKWLATAYQFYKVPLATEPAGGLKHNDFVRRMFSDASCGARQFFTYEFDAHAGDIQRYIHLLTGTPGDTEIAVFCPTTLWRLGGDLRPTIASVMKLRDFADFDVLDELLINDGALMQVRERTDRGPRYRYQILVMFQREDVESATLQHIRDWAQAGGWVVVIGEGPLRDVDGKPWEDALYRLVRVADRADVKTLDKVLQNRPGVGVVRGIDGARDGVWTTRRGGEVLKLNTTDHVVRSTVAVGSAVLTPEIGPHEIWESKEFFERHSSPP